MKNPLPLFHFDQCVENLQNIRRYLGEAKRKKIIKLKLAMIILNGASFFNLVPFKDIEGNNLVFYQSLINIVVNHDLVGGLPEIPGLILAINGITMVIPDHHSAIIWVFPYNLFNQFLVISNYSVFHFNSMFVKITQYFTTRADLC